MKNLKFNREQILEALANKGANKPCQRCGHTNFALIQGFTKHQLFEHTNGVLIMGELPTILIVCDNCGSISPHAAFALVNPEKEGGKNGI